MVAIPKTPLPLILPLLFPSDSCCHSERRADNFYRPPVEESLKLVSPNFLFPRLQDLIRRRSINLYRHIPIRIRNHLAAIRREHFSRQEVTVNANSKHIAQTRRPRHTRNPVPARNSIRFTLASLADLSQSGNRVHLPQQSVASSRSPHALRCVLPKFV